MKKIIEYITDDDRKESYYKSADHFFRKENINKDRVVINNRNCFLNYLQELNTDFEPLLLTIISHAYNGEDPKGLCRGGLRESLITWQELYTAVNDSRTKNPLSLNLLTPCHSSSINECIVNNNRIDKIWSSNVQNPTIKYSLILAYDYNGCFENFREWYEYEEYQDEFPYIERTSYQIQ